MRRDKPKATYFLYAEDGRMLGVMMPQRKVYIGDAIRSTDGQNWRVWYMEEHPGGFHVAKLEPIGDVEAHAIGLTPEPTP